MNRAETDGNGVKWFHYEPGREDAFQTGWCHGPAGTCRLFLKLYDLTGNARYLETARKGAAWLMARLDPGDGLTAKAAITALYASRGESGAPDGFDDLRDAIEELCPTFAGRPPTPAQLGYQLRKNRHRVIGGRHFDSAAARGGVIRWRVVRVKMAAGGDGGDGGNPDTRRGEEWMNDSSGEADMPTIAPVPTSREDSGGDP